MTGVWSDSASGQAIVTWNLTQTSGAPVYQAVSGTATSPSVCGGQITWNVSGKYELSEYSIYASGGSPATAACNGQTYTTLNQYIYGTLEACGLGLGSFSATVPSSGTIVLSGNNTLTVAERVPTGENSAFSTEQDDYGDPTIAAFNMTLGTKQPDVNFGGRVVYETNPQGATGSDSCWFAQAPFPKATSLAQFDSWNVQNDNISGSYGPDYIGLDGNEVAFYQTYSPSMLSPGNCTIQYPVQMVINKETVAQGAPVVTETYGGPQTGYNQIVIVISRVS